MLSRIRCLRAEGTGAAGFFKVAIRRDPAGAELWSLALEWNRAFRIIGFFGDLEAAQVYVDQIPPLSWQRIDATQRMRREVELADEDDRLFAPVDACGPSKCQIREAALERIPPVSATGFVDQPIEPGMKPPVLRASS